MSARRVDGQRRQARQVASRAAGLGGGPDALERFADDPMVESALDPALVQEGLDHVSGDVRRAELGDDPGAACTALGEDHLPSADPDRPSGEAGLTAALEQRLGDEKAPASSDDRDEALAAPAAHGLDGDGRRSPITSSA